MARMHGRIHCAALGAANPLDGWRSTVGIWRETCSALGNLLGHSIGLALVAVLGRAEQQPGLNHWRGSRLIDHPLYIAVAVAALELEQSRTGAFQAATTCLGKGRGQRA
jgi:hypothetical protein